MFGTPAQHCLAHIIDAKDEQTKEMCLAELRDITGQDFGQDIDHWYEWVRTHSSSNELHSDTSFRAIEPDKK